MKSARSRSRSEADLDCRPWLWALLILFGAAWFMPTEASLRGGLGMPLNVLWFVWLAGLFGFWSYHLTSERSGALPTLAWVDRLWLCFFVWHTLSVLLGWNFRWLEPRPAIGLMWQQLAMATVYVGGRLICRSEENRSLVLQCVVALGVSVSLFAWFQYLVVLPELHRQYSSATEAEKIAQLAGAGITDTQPGSRMRELFESRLFNREPFGTFSLTNTLAAILVPVALLSLITGLERLWRRHWWIAAWWLMAWIVSVSAMAITSSRTSLLAFGLTVVMWLGSRFWLGQRMPASGRWIVGAVGLLIGLPVALVVGLWAVGQSDSQLFSGAPESVQYRLQYWVASSEMIAARPWFGWGPGNFQSAYAAFQPPQASETIADPHNFFFEIAATSGLPAALALLGAVALSIYRGRERGLSVGDLAVNHMSGDGPLSEGVRPPATSGWRVGGLPLFLGLVLMVGMGLGLGCAWLGESLPTPILYVSVGVLLATGWWMAVHDSELLLLTRSSAEEHRPISDAARWALLGLMLSLLASGGINYPAIGSCVVLLAALTVGKSPAIANTDDGSNGIWRQRATWQIAAVGLMFVAVYMYLYDTLPVIRSEWAMQRSRFQLTTGNFSGAERELRLAKQLDPWRGDARVDLAVLDLMKRVNERGNVQVPADLEKRLREAAAFRPSSSSARRRFGEAYLQASINATEDPHCRTLLESAKDWLEEAMERKPVDAALVAQVSWLHHLLGAEATASRLAARVESLGQLNPHSDLRLRNQWFLALESAIPQSLAPDCRPVGPGPNGLVQMNVEAWIKWALERNVTAK